MIRHWRVLALLLVLGIMALGGRYAWTRHTAEEREASYEATLRSYAEALRPGRTRKEVEGYLEAKGSPFNRTCCVGRGSNTYDVITPIGSEPHPWYCNKHHVYIRFVFVATDTDPTATRQANDSDILTNVSIFHRLEECL